MENYLSLNYNLPKDTIRNYKIMIDKSSLVLNENGINFSFNKPDLKSTTPTSGININICFQRNIRFNFSTSYSLFI